jgi:VanZ family protein
MIRHIKRTFSENEAIKLFYRIIFWSGYGLILLTSLLKIGGNLDKVHINLGAFELRLDHLLHIAVYFVLTMYYTTGQYFGLVLFKKHAMLKFFFLLILLGTITVFVQIWVPYRAFSLADWTSNMAGILVGYLTGIVINRLAYNSNYSSHV